jgi:hypothetical protein
MHSFSTARFMVTHCERESISVDDRALPIAMNVEWEVWNRDVDVES